MEPKQPKFTDDDVPEFVDIPLSRAIEINGTKLTSLRMRQPLMSDQKAGLKATGTEDEKEIKFMANLCDMAPADMEKLSIRDFKKVQVTFFDFTGGP